MNMTDNQLMVSIWCTVYNHEKYLRQCLDSLIMQETDFSYEIVVHDDASTDSSPEIIKEYCGRYPAMFRTVFQKENQYSKGVDITKEFFAPDMRGKYVAICEGDDYWTDTHKLQKQVEAMEKNKQCKMCVHRVRRVNEDGSDGGVLIPEFELESGAISSDKFIEYVCDVYSFQTSSYMFETKAYKEYWEKKLVFRDVAPCGDIPYMLYFGQLSSVFFIDEIMSDYRYGSVGSWSLKRDSAREQYNKMDSKIADMYAEFDIFTNGVYHQPCNTAKQKRYYSIAKRNRDIISLLKQENREFLKTSIKSHLGIG